MSVSYETEKARYYCVHRADPCNKVYRAGKRQMCARDLRLHGLVNVWGT